MLALLLRRRFAPWPISFVAPVALIPALVLGWAISRYVGSVLTGVGAALVLFSCFLAVVYAYRRRREARLAASQGRYAPDLLPVWLVALLAVALALLLGRVIYQMALDYFEREAGAQKSTKPVNINDVFKVTVTVLTVAGAVLAGVYAYRKQLVAEGDAHRADASQLAERYTTATGQLGHDRAAVRLAGVYALTRLADDWKEQRQVCIDVLCAYLRMPYEPDPAYPGHKEGEREVRHTIIRVIRDHLRSQARTSWCAYDFDFTGALFDGGDLSLSHFCGTVVFDQAMFRGDVDFRKVALEGGAVGFHKAAFEGGSVNFSTAEFSSGTVDFREATFSGATVNFYWATFSGATIHFDEAHFIGGSVDFTRAEFNGSTVYFDEAHFIGGSAVGYRWARFIEGRVDFTKAHFIGGDVNFYMAGFTGSWVGFGKAEFTSGRVDFAGATFSRGTVHFSEAQFTSGTVTFGTAHFIGGTVNFSGALGEAPDGLPPSGSLPAGLSLPPAWC